MMSSGDENPVTVERIEIIGLLADRPVPVWSALHGSTGSITADDLKRPALLIKLTTSDGHVGWGQSHVSRQSLHGLATLIRDELAPLVVGTEPSQVADTHKRMSRMTYLHGRQGIMRAAIAGIDVALWDLAAQIRQMPLHRLLGGSDIRVPAYASGGFYRHDDSPGRLAEEVTGYVEEGFRAVKIKIAGAAIETDTERVTTTREAIGETVGLMVDANRNYHLAEAQQMGSILDQLGAIFFEEPLPAESIDELKRLRETIGTPIAGFETVTTPSEYRWLIHHNLLDIVQPDVIWSGGITDSMAIAELAASAALPIAPHAISSALSLVANLHFAAAIADPLAIEVDRTRSPLSTDLLAPVPRLDAEGALTLPELPGLGIEIDVGFVESHAVLHFDEPTKFG